MMGSHYYIRGPNGPQRYRPLKADGTEYIRIPAAMAARAGAVPSVTEMLSILGDTGWMIPWAAGMGVKAGLQGGTEAEAKERCKAEMERASNEGTGIHDAIDAYLTGLPDRAVLSDNPIHATAQIGAAEWLLERGIEPPYRCEHCLLYRGEINGVKVEVGGTTDLVLPTILADWKSIEDTGRGFRSEKWSECAQLAVYRLAAYVMGLCASYAECWNVYFDRRTGNIVRTIKWSDSALKHGLGLMALAFTVQHEIELIEAFVKRKDSKNNGRATA